MMKKRSEKYIMNKLCKVVSVFLIISTILLVGCGSKEESKVDRNVSKQEETAAITEQEESKEVTSTETEESKEVREQEASKGEDIDYLEIHGITLDKIYTWIMDGIEEANIAEGEQVIIDAIKEFGQYAHYDLGYAITEVNDDGIPELVIGQTTQEGINNMIYAIYTWKDGGFQCNAEGAEYGAIVPGAVNNTEVLFLNPFSDYEPGTKAEAGLEMPDMNEPQVAVQWIDDVYLEPNGYDVFTADDGAEQRQVVFIAISKVSDFKVLTLTFEGVSENGSMVQFATTELYSQPELKPERPLMVGMSCESSIPCYGFSYVDENGVTRRFAIEVSGMDGSVLLSEF